MTRTHSLKTSHCHKKNTTPPKKHSKKKNKINAKSQHIWLTKLTKKNTTHTFFFFVSHAYTAIQCCHNTHTHTHIHTYTHTDNTKRIKKQQTHKKKKERAVCIMYMYDLTRLYAITNIDSRAIL